MSDHPILEEATHEAVRWGVGSILVGVAGGLTIWKSKIIYFFKSRRLREEENSKSMASIATSLDNLAQQFKEERENNKKIADILQEGFKALMRSHLVSAKMAELALENSPIAMWRCNSDGEADWVNKACADYFELPIRDMLGKGWQAKVHPDHRHKVQEALNRTRKYHEPYNVGYSVRGKDHWKNSFASGTAIVDENNNLINIIGIIEPVETSYNDQHASSAA